MEEKKTSLAYRLIKGAVRLCYPVIEPVGTENLPSEPAIIVGNHSQMNGPSPASSMRPATITPGAPGK